MDIKVVFYFSDFIQQCLGGELKQFWIILTDTL